MIVRLFFLLLCHTIIKASYSSNSSFFDNPQEQWKFITASMKSSSNIRCGNLPLNVPGGFFANGETKYALDKTDKIKIYKENCITAINSLLDIHLPRNKRKYKFKFSNVNRISEIIDEFCEQTVTKFQNISSFIDLKSTQTQQDKVKVRKQTIEKSPIEGTYSDNYLNKIDDSILDDTSFSNKPELSSYDSSAEESTDIKKLPKMGTETFEDYSLILDETYKEKKLQKPDKFKSKSPKLLISILRSVLEDVKDDLPTLEISVSQLPKLFQNKALSFFRSKDIDSITELLSKLPGNVIESFINSLEIEAKRINRLSDVRIKSMEFSVPLLEDEWNAIVNFMNEPTSPVQIGEKNRGIVNLKIPSVFKYSNGIERKFIQYCRRAIRSLAYDEYVSEDGVTYYGYDENNKNNILISGNDSNHRKEQVEAFCYMVYQRIYGKRDKELQKKRHNRILNRKKSWEEGGVDGKIIDELLKGFSNEVNDERLQWLFLVETASIPNPLVYSNDLPKHSIPISFTTKPTEGTIEITGKIRSYIYNCRSALMTLGIEKYPGSDLPLYKLQLGPEKMHGIMKFCKSTAQRYMGRLVEWFNIIQASLDDEIINLIDPVSPEFRCPDYFEYGDDTKLVENCSKAIMTMIDENKASQKSGKNKIWPGLKIKCQPNHIVQHIRSFCKSVSYEKPEIRIATIKELSEGAQTDDVNTLTESNSDDYQQEAIETVEERLKNIEGKRSEEQTNSAYKLDKWNQLQNIMTENRMVREKLDKSSRRQFQQLVEVEESFKELIMSIVTQDEIIRSNQKKEAILDLIDKYSTDVLAMRTEWSDLMYQISNSNRKITESEIEITNFVHQALDYTAISHRVELVNSLTMVSMMNWEQDLEEKESKYIQSKMEEYNKRLDYQYKIQDLKNTHLRRRQLFEKHLFRILPRKLWNKISTLGSKGLYPIIPQKISNKELQDRKTLIVRLQEEKNNMVSHFDSEGQKLAKQLLVIEHVINKRLADLNEMWDSTYSIEYSIQWELRIKDMQDTYIFLNNEYNRHVELITRQQLRQSQLQINHPYYQQFLKETNEAIESSTEEMKKILKMMNDLRQKRNELDTIVESDMSRNYAEKINTLRINSKLLEQNISKDISITQKKSEILQMQLDRDIKYFEITNLKNALSERIKKNEGLIEANTWLNEKNMKLILDYEKRLRDDLKLLTYKFESDSLKEKIPESAIPEIKKFKEKLKVNLFNVGIYNDHIQENDMDNIRQFESFDLNILTSLESFESEGAIDDGTLYSEISILEWNFIQSRWELLKMKHFYIEKKEEILIECAEMRNSLDSLMYQNFGLVPITRQETSSKITDLLTITETGISLDDKGKFEDDRQPSYDEKVLKLVQKRLEDANSVFEQELSTRLNILDEQIREGRIRLHEAAREVSANWDLQQSTAAFRFASPQNKDRMRETFVKERDRVTREEIKKTRPMILEKHIILQQQKDRALQFKRDIDWIHAPERVAGQLMKFEQKMRIFRKKRHDHYERTLNFLISQAEKVDRIKQIDEELNSAELTGLGYPETKLAIPSKVDELKKEKEKLEIELNQMRKEYQIKLSSFQNERDALYDVNKNLKDDEDE
ncbi:hypothetical protein FG386_000837 [Cryptosporidium ryanae]|uniref:uncharacterized protein n=1 Tax=Cryptosporidium ryanae TaxID=515981 RepID=UPI00351A8ECE|nr:hypothetical protein FG386_000837 [Cryptosporidium ryanae]